MSAQPFPFGDTGGNTAQDAFARYLKLRVVRNLADVIRRWFRVEVTFVDEGGYARAYAGGRIFEPSNPVCRPILDSRDGFRACMQSSGQAFDLVQLGTPAEKRGSVAESVCHMGLRSLVLPIEVAGRRIGALVAGGLAPAGDRAEWAPRLLERAARAGADAASIEAALPHLPQVDELSQQYLVELLRQIVAEIARFHAEAAEKDATVTRLTDELAGKYAFGTIVGVSSAMHAVLDLLAKVAGSDSTVLLQGENGTGKELLARALHHNSPRVDKPFVMQSAAAFHENLLETELFGHVKGSFTGAVKDKKGLFEVADGGTFFLDEIGEMSPALQVKLLRVLQEGTFLPVGATESRRVDVRLVCATHRDLRKMVERGEFREDLFYRINVINLAIPPLRDRRDDIPYLVKHFLRRFAVEKKVPVKELDDEVLERFFDYEWPGNIRELENEVERLVVLAGDDRRIGPELLSARIKERAQRANVKGVRVDKTLDEILEEVERRVLSEGLRKHRWNKTQLARQLGISRKGLIAKVQRYQLDRRKEPR